MKKQLFLTAIALLSMLSIPLHASVQIGDLYYNLDEATQTAEVARGEYSGNIVIPSSVAYNGYTYNVTSIGNSTFYNCSGLTSITIPESVTSIGSSAFLGCKGLTSITIPNSVTSIGSSALSGCKGLTSITIPDSVKTIKNSAFSGCTNISSVVWNAVECSGWSSSTSPFSSAKDNITSFTFGDKVDSIPSYLCYGMSKLTSIIIPNSVTTIGNYAFCGCKGLTSITIPNSVTSIGERAFQNCSSLTSITIPDSVMNIGNFAFSGCTNISSVVWNAAKCSGWSNSSNSPFLSAKENITSFTFGDKVETIPSNLCYGMSKLTSITIPESVTSIGSSAFSSCSGLTSITIPDSVKTIENSAFANCSGLTSITIPESVTSIGSSAFKGCTNISSVVWNAAKCSGWSSSSNSPFLSAKENITSFTFGDKVETIPSYLCYGMSELTSITIPESVTSIGNYAFSNCTRLTSITIPENVTSIGDNAFSGCTNISSVVWNAESCSDWSSRTSPFFSIKDNITSFTFGDKVETIPSYLCEGMSKLTSITIPESVTSIGNDAFRDCLGLTSITIPDNVTSIGISAFNGCSSLTSVTIGNSVTSIEDATFFNCSSLTSVTIGNSVASIEGLAFHACSSLISITIPESVTRIEGAVFLFCTGLTSVVWNAKSCSGWSFGSPFSSDNITSFTFGDKVETIPSYLCYGMSKLTSITIPENVTSIGDNAFSDCTNISSVVWNAAKCSGWSSSSNSPFLSAKENITSFTFGNKVDSIPNYLCYGMSKLTSITIPENVTSIEQTTFSGCTNISSVVWNAVECSGWSSSTSPFSSIKDNITSFTFGDKVETIPSYLCYGMSKLTSITIPESVTSIGNDAFYGCTGLTSVVIPNSVTNCGYNVLGFCENITSITAPAALYSNEQYRYGAEYLSKEAKPLESLTLTSGTMNESVFAVIQLYYKTLKTLDISQVENTTLNDKAFEDFYNLETLRLPANLTNIQYMAIANCKSLEAITIPATMVEIDNSVFENCRSLQSVTFAGSDVQTIGDWAFYNCHELQSITIPEGVTEIGKAAFYGCTYLTNLNLPTTVQSIEDNGFALCSKLKKISVSATIPPDIDAKTFEDVDRSIPLCVPAGTRQSYANAPYWEEFINIQEDKQETIPTSVSTTPAVNTTAVQKILRDGQVYILRGDKVYTTTGILVK